MANNLHMIFEKDIKLVKDVCDFYPKCENQIKRLGKCTKKKLGPDYLKYDCYQKPKGKEKGSVEALV